MSNLSVPALFIFLSVLAFAVSARWRERWQILISVGLTLWALAILWDMLTVTPH